MTSLGWRGRRARAVFGLAALACVLASAPAHASATAAVQKGPRAYLPVPIWYLSYRVDIEAGSRGWPDDGSHLTSTTVGTAKLGVRTMGPSLSFLTRPMEPMEAIEATKTAASWLQSRGCDSIMGSSAPYEDIEACMKRWIDSTAAVQALTYKEVHEDLKVSASGLGKVIPASTEFMLEIDAARDSFALVLPWQFNDTETSNDGVKGTREMREWKNDHYEWETTPEVSDFWNYATGCRFETTPESAGAGLLFRGALGASFEPLSGRGSWPIAFDRGRMKGMLVVSYTLSPNPPSDVELVITPDAQYADWEPKGGVNESDEGSGLLISAKLQKTGGGAPTIKATRFIYRLLATSHERGVCLNWPETPAVPLPPDLKFVPAEGLGYRVTDVDGQVAEASGDALTSGQVQIACYDYGAHGALQVTAELPDGRQVVGVVEGTADRSLKIPKRKPDSIIAEHYLAQVGERPDSSDAEDEPVGDSFRGDGLTLYEEYRGFMCGGAWARGDAKKKDLFVFKDVDRRRDDVEAGVDIYRAATEIVVHSDLLPTEIGPECVINRYHSDGPHAVDQHAIRIRLGPSGGKWADVEHPGTPGTAGPVTIPGDWSNTATRRSRDANGNETAFTVPLFPYVVAHEMLHASNVYHHGAGDMKEVTWSYVGSPRPHIEEDGVGEIKVLEEDGTVIAPGQYFSNPSAQSHMTMYVGVPMGQHSGDNFCLMRYNIADAYARPAGSNVRYSVDDEVQAPRLCTVTTGTGVNESERKPYSRYGPAAPPNVKTGVKKQRGDCLHQIRVSDRGSAPER